MTTSFSSISALAAARPWSPRCVSRRGCGHNGTCPTSEGRRFVFSAAATMTIYLCRTARGRKNAKLKREFLEDELSFRHKLKNHRRNFRARDEFQTDLKGLRVHPRPDWMVAANHGRTLIAMLASFSTASASRTCLIASIDPTTTCARETTAWLGWKDSNSEMSLRAKYELCI
jgi:hypothetical protein